MYLSARTLLRSVQDCFSQMTNKTDFSFWERNISLPDIFKHSRKRIFWEAGSGRQMHPLSPANPNMNVLVSSSTHLKFSSSCMQSPGEHHFIPSLITSTFPQESCWEAVHREPHNTIFITPFPSTISAQGCAYSLHCHATAQAEHR